MQKYEEKSNLQNFSLRSPENTEGKEEISGTEKKRKCLLKWTNFTPTIKKYFVSLKIVCIFALQKRSNKATVFAVETDNT